MSIQRFNCWGNIRWLEGSDPAAKPGLFSGFLRLIGAGGHATSLGADVLVIRGRSENAKFNEAIFEVYSHANTAGPVATAFGNTIPAPPTEEDPMV